MYSSYNIIESINSDWFRMKRDRNDKLCSIEMYWEINFITEFEVKVIKVVKQINFTYYTYINSF